MKRIIKDGTVVDDAWQTWRASDFVPGTLAGKGRRTILPLQIFAGHADGFADNFVSVGVLLGADDDPAQVFPYLDKLPLIAVDFPCFADGRGYSIGQLLRSRHGFSGELRAVGDILRDQLYFLERCGFNAFELRDDQDPEAALAAFGDYAWQPNSLIQGWAAKIMRPNWCPVSDAGHCGWQFRPPAATTP